MIILTKKSAIISAVIISFLAIGALGAMPAMAEDLANYPRIVQKIADRFGLDEDEVQKVLVEFREEHKAQMQENFYTRLNNLVESGKITANQKQAIISKFEEMKEEHKKLDDLSPEERNAKIKDHLNNRKNRAKELKTWAQENNIDLELLPKMHIGHGKAHGHWH